MHLFDLPNKQDYIEALLSSQNILIPNASKLKLMLEDYREGAYCIVIPAMMGRKKYAIRCWKCIDETTRALLCHRMNILSKKLAKYYNSYFVDFDFYEAGIVTVKGVFPMMIMPWCDDMNFDEFIQNYLSEVKVLQRIALSFLNMTDYLHRNKISHGDLQPDNIRVRTDGSLYLIDYDTLYLPCMQFEKDSVKGRLEYQHPSRKYNEFLSPYMDYFAEYILYLSILIAIKFPNNWHDTIIVNRESLFIKNNYSNICNSKLYRFLEQVQDADLQKFMGYFVLALEENELSKITPINKLLHK